MEKFIVSNQSTQKISIDHASSTSNEGISDSSFSRELGERFRSTLGKMTLLASGLALTGGEVEASRTIGKELSPDPRIVRAVEVNSQAQTPSLSLDPTLEWDKSNLIGELISRDNHQIALVSFREEEEEFELTEEGETERGSEAGFDPIESPEEIIDESSGEPRELSVEEKTEAGSDIAIDLDTLVERWRASLKDKPEFVREYSSKLEKKYGSYLAYRALEYCSKQAEKESGKDYQAKFDSAFKTVMDVITTLGPESKSLSASTPVRQFSREQLGHLLGGLRGNPLPKDFVPSILKTNAFFEKNRGEDIGLQQTVLEITIETMSSPSKLLRDLDELTRHTRALIEPEEEKIKSKAGK